MVDIVTRVNNVVNGFVWGPFGLALLLCTGLWLSVRTGFFQFRRMGYWLKHTIGAIFTNKDVTAHTSKEDMAISQFQSMCTALAGTIGTGNIVGVATAIVSGGPGAIFWMWVMALLGMMTSFAENVLGVYYRRKNEKGEWSGGAMYYLTDGLGAKPGCRAVGKVLAVLFACFCILASFGIGNMSQINSIAGNMNAAFHVPYLATGLALMVVTALIVIGGLKRVAAVTEKLVPLMALFYVVGCIVILCANYDFLLPALKAIFVLAFKPGAVTGGLVGGGIRLALQYGVARGLFSNESGMGSAPLVASAAQTRNPVRQALVSATGTFWTTVVVCLMTGLVLVSSMMKNPAVSVENMVNGGQMTTAAFAQIPYIGPLILMISIITFAYSTILGWSYYGERAAEYLLGKKAILPYKVLFIAVVVCAPVLALDLVWTIADVLNAFMAIPNLIAVLLLSGVIAAETKHYLKHLDEKDESEIPVVDR